MRYDTATTIDGFSAPAGAHILRAPRRMEQSKGNGRSAGCTLENGLRGKHRKISLER